MIYDDYVTQDTLCTSRASQRMLLVPFVALLSATARRTSVQYSGARALSFFGIFWILCFFTPL